MLSSRKRKQISGLSSAEPLRTAASCRSQPTKDPYSGYPRPTADECRSVRNDLLSLHGFPLEFVKYREHRLQMSLGESQILDNGGECGEKESVLDGLIRTILSQNTTEVNSERAFGNLKCAFPTWEQVLAAESKGIEDAIRCGGLAPTKSSCIQNLLGCLLQKKGKLCMEYLRELPIEEIKAELSHFKGIGPKTNSVSKDISASIIFAESAALIWLDLKDRFLQSNGSRIFQLRRELMNLEHEQLSVSHYFTKLKGLWDELSNFRPNCTCGKCTCGGVKELTAHHQMEYVMAFLMGLNDTYAQIRGQLLLLDPLPPINKVFSLISQEERQANNWTPINHH
ncbi:DNA glycosylase [Dorcoceras hygrometricum]|uniref:DNA glycosylase n=1 Tax=Dorcoceras hygrometricum TaxID=472368 RepID=A0A2Z7BAC6_9LAMI|nr:DNA glycosylase [Dorcoceras hygrometricum]